MTRCVAGAAFVIAFIITDDELRFFLASPISPVYYCLCSAVDVLCDWVLFAIVDIFSFYFFLISFTIKSNNFPHTKRRISIIQTENKISEIFARIQIDENTTWMVFISEFLFSFTKKKSNNNNNDTKIFSLIFLRMSISTFFHHEKKNKLVQAHNARDWDFVYFYLIHLKRKYPCNRNALTCAIS